MRWLVILALAGCAPRWECMRHDSAGACNAWRCATRCCPRPMPRVGGAGVYCPIKECV